MVNYMSTIIGLCGTNYCLLASDSRMVTPDEEGNWTVKNDSTNKIIKVNDNVIYGATGQFWSSERIDEPIRHREYTNEASLLETVAITEKYMADNLVKVMSFRRQYIIAGREYDGSFCIVTIRLNDEKKGIERTVYRSDDPRHHASVIALPASLSDKENAERYSAILYGEVIKCKSLNELIASVNNVIHQIADADVQHTVGGDTKYIVLT